MSVTKSISLSIILPDESAFAALAAALRTAAAQLDSPAVPQPVVPSTQPAYPATEAPLAMVACKAMWQNAQQENPELFNIHDFIGQGLVQGATPGAVPRMSQETQDRLEAAIRALGRSEWGQKWLADDYCASMIDRKYCFEFVGYWVTRVSANPDDGFKRHYNRPL